MRRWAAGAAVAALVLTACTAADGSGAEAVPDLPTIEPGALTACVAPVPWATEGADDAPAGHDVAVLEAVADELALRLEVVPTTVDDAVAGVELTSGRCDVAAAAVVARPALAGSVTTSSPYHEVHHLLVASAPGPTLEPSEVTASVGVEDGGPAADTTAALPAAEVVPYPSRADLGRAVAQGLVDQALVTLADRVALEEQLATPLHVRALVPSGERTVFLLPLDAADEVVVAVDEALATLAAEGRLDDLADRWLHD